MEVKRKQRTVSEAERRKSGRGEGNTSGKVEIKPRQRSRVEH